MPPNPQNLGRQWKPGESGNPSGRPKTKLLADQIRCDLQENVKDILTVSEMDKANLTQAEREMPIYKMVSKRFIRATLAGNSAGTRQFQEMMDRIDGRVPLPLIGADDGPVQIEWINHIDYLSPAERKKPVRRPSRKRSSKPQGSLPS